MIDVVLDKSCKLNNNKPVAVAIGKFDGIHRGHMALLDILLDCKKKGMLTAVITFDKPLVSYFTKKQSYVLTTMEEKRAILKDIGIDIFAVYPVNETTMSLSAEAFVEKVLAYSLGAKMVVAGRDLSFGKGGEGNIRLLQALSPEYNYDVICADKVLSSEGREISSTLVRNAVEAGDLERAYQLMGRYYSIGGIVKKGKQMGRTIGLPTANIEIPNQKVQVPNGVYLSNVVIGGREYAAVSNIGLRPTVENTDIRNCETHIIDFNDDIYGEYIDVHLCSFLRREIKFKSIDELQFQIMHDIECRKNRIF